MSDRPDGPPEEITKVHNQVRWNSVDFVIDFPGLVDRCTNMNTIRVDDRLKFGFEFVAQRFNLAGLDDTLRLAAFDVQEDARIIVAIAPDAGLAPVNLASITRGEHDGHL